MILLRHGQSEFNVVFGKTRQDPGIRDPALTALGREQAVAAAAHLSNGAVGRRIRRIVSSPYTRTLQTAEIVAAGLGLPVEVDVLIGERAAFVCDIGTPCAALRQRWPRLRLAHLAEEWWPIPVESETALDARSRLFRDAMAAQDNWHGTLVVTHWGFIRALTGHRVENCALVTFDPTADHPGGGTVVPLGDPC